MEQSSGLHAIMTKDGSTPQDPAGGSTVPQDTATIQTGRVQNHTRNIEVKDKVDVKNGDLSDNVDHTVSVDNGKPDIMAVTTEGVPAGNQCSTKPAQGGHVTHSGDQSETTDSVVVPESDTRVQHHTPPGGGGGIEEGNDRKKETGHKPTRHVTYSEGVDELEFDKAMKLLQKNGDQVYRMVFKNEMHRLHRELETFNEEITKQYEKNARRIEKKKQALEDELNELEQRRANARQQMEEEESVKELSQQQQEEDEDNSVRRKVLIDKEMELLDREEKLTARQKQLEEYEAEIDKIEGYLDRRMDIARRRNTELIELDGEQRAFIQQKLTVETPAEEVMTDEPDNDQGQPTSQPQAPVAVENTRYDLLQEKNTQLELVLKKTKADLAHSENSRQQLETKVSELEKAQQQSTKRIAELERHMFLNQTNLSSSLNHRMSLYPESTTDPSHDDLASLADSTVLHTTSVPATVGHPASNIMKPVRFSVKIKPSRTPSLHSAPASPSTTAAHSLIERPALTWQLHEPRRQQRKSSISAHSSPQPASHRRLSTHTSPLPVTQHRLSNAHTAPLPQHQHKLAPAPTLPAVPGNKAYGEVGPRQNGAFRDTWSDSELLQGERAPPKSGICVVQ